MGSAAFLSALLFLGRITSVFSYVEPPTNVTLYCHNMQNILKWTYKQLSPDLRFRVTIGAVQPVDEYPIDIWVNSTAQLQADVSFLFDPTNDYYLEVTAVIGQNESTPEEGLSFSYFMESQVDYKCHLDFPSVNVTTQHDGTVLFRFTHPSLVYHKLASSLMKRTRREKSHKLPKFHYDVVIRQKEQHYNFVCEESVCEKTMHVDATQTKHCLKMNGQLEKILVQATQDYCALPREQMSYRLPIAIVCSLLALSVFGFVLYMVYRKVTTPNTSSPTSMIFPTLKKHMIAEELPRETCIVPEVEPTSPTPLVSAEEKEFTSFGLPDTEHELRLPIRVSTGEEGVCADEDGAITKESGYMQGRHLEDVEVPYSSEGPSGYEKRLLLVKLSPDELTEGYRG